MHVTVSWSFERQGVPFLWTQEFSQSEIQERKDKKSCFLSLYTSCLFPTGQGPCMISTVMK